MLNQQKGWLTVLGEQELQIVREYGRDHAAHKAACKAWEEAFEIVLSIRHNYYLPSHDRTPPVP